MTDWLQYAAAITIVKILGALPRPISRAIAAGVARAAFAFLPKLRKTAEFN
jgi:lauroyl/myristoyl acyltransferase